MPNEHQISAYCWPQSVRTNEHVTLFCHTNAARFSVSVVRQGAVDQQVFEETSVSGHVQDLPPDLAAEGCEWQPSLEIQVEPNWPSGFYLVQLSTPDGVSAEAFFVVRADTRRNALLVLSTSTWAAYNDWGGPSFYTGGHVSSTRRPLPRGFLKKPDPERLRVARVGDLPPDELRNYMREGYSYWSMAAGWCNQEILFARWAERNDITLDYAASHDLDRDPDLLTDRPAYLSVGHDEYWSEGMRDTVENFIEAGGRAAFFSGNTAFWQIRFENDYQQVVGYKMALAADPVYGTDEQRLLSTMWSDPLVGRPENELTGVSFTRGGYAHMANAPKGSGGYAVWRPAHWAFADLELTAGDMLGAEPVVVGYECDGCELTLEDGLPVATGVDGTPTNFSVLGTAPAHLWETHEGAAGLPDIYVGELNWVAERLGGADTAENRARFAHGYAVMGSFTKGRGEVFTTGCTDWAYGLGDEQVARVTANVLRHYGAI
jgi:hypothetical protein